MGIYLDTAFGDSGSVIGDDCMWVGVALGGWDGGEIGLLWRVEA